MIPKLVDIGSPWKVLPPGIHEASLTEIKIRFANTPHRKKLFNGFRNAIKALKQAGCFYIYLNGSFVTEKPEPEDFDACWCTENVDFDKLDPVLLTFDNKRTAQKRKYYGELFPSISLADSEKVFLDFFQVDRFTGKPKGIIYLKL
jgi:hypothetical protein